MPRPAKPSAKALAGSPGKRAINGKEPKPTVRPTAPEIIIAAALAVWALDGPVLLEPPEDGGSALLFGKVKGYRLRIMDIPPPPQTFVPRAD